ncbi:SDR family NAD(P)-dependent oxidoreductase [Salicibibacter cibi]|uniref:SDR family NAD(P)-dependent oxidoreductase n=1 Tax=Salicibibacter cibi TaxID=2743001 RepID=A0A7T6ZBJ5_9BACI|nr:SDR family NAD(P)-dependent oxidoreductase [Salicibibacter cibi]QQK80483.1 SDR family NAD(P)-dependent oxidoreductase [Salicibibacter cibi]
MEDKVAIVTGGGGDIGRSVALHFAQEKAKVMISDVDKDAGKETANMIIIASRN